MKLPDYSASLEEQLAEFDVWITPSLGEVRDTDRFAAELDAITKVLDLMAAATTGFIDEKHISCGEISRIFLSACDEEANPAEATRILMGLASLLFLVTGRSDNNSKCQFPIFLRDHASWDTYPTVRAQSGSPRLVERPLPRVLKADQLMANVVSLGPFPEVREKLLSEFIQYILTNPEDVHQLWSIGRSYIELQKVNRHKSLITPLVIFQVRGSVSASGGHGPEDLLRAQMEGWGLAKGIDFNINDVIVESVPIGARKHEKTRAYDFVLPFRSPNWPQRIFIQCQFYAGDSGSVSHKNVDQTTSSRLAVRLAIEDPIFVEYVDGAGYFSSLNGDLKALLAMEDTASFIQVRTAIVRLRRELQRIGFLTPIDVAHACLRSESDAELQTILLRDGYTAEEIKRSFQVGIETGVLVHSKRLLVADDEAVNRIVTGTALLDCIAMCGQKLNGDRSTMRGHVLIPGYGPFFGLPIGDAVRRTAELLPGIGCLWKRPEDPTLTMQWLVDRGHAMLM